LTEEATETLKSYYWQGNIRQLKNVAMQISLIEQRRDITPEILAQYLPQYQMHRGLAVIGAHTQQQVPTEDIKMLYNLVGVLKREVDLLKKELEKTSQGRSAHVQEEEFVNWEPNNVLQSVEEDAVIQEVVPEVIPEIVNDLGHNEMKLTDIERETIRRTLLKNGGNRKATAIDLGLSERTLYRKIKDYGL
jgi:DNA-binding NtrC family response regulator